MGNTSGQGDQRKRLSKKELRQKRKIERTVGLALAAVLLIVMAVFVGLLMFMDVLPTIYLVAIVVVLILVLLYVFLSQFTKAHMIGKVLSVLLSIVLALGCYYVAVASNALSNISNSDATVDVMSIIVLADDKAEAVNDIGDYIIGINGSVNVDLTQETLIHLEEETGKTALTTTYENWSELVDALYLGEVNAIIFNEGFRTTMEEYYVTFSDDTKVLGTKEIENTIVVKVPDKEITDESFTVLLSGTDSEGKLNMNGRSDVNIIATINPITKDILLITTPRDLYVTLYYGDGTNSGNGKDKLTHTGISGIACTMTTLEAIYDVEIDYYVKLNFTGMVKLVDALGGLDVESDYAFTSYAKTHTYTKGMNHMDGQAALIFARERYAFADGDFQRSRNQIKVIQAIADKALSVSMLNNYTGIMDSLSSFVVTNIPQDQLTKLVKMQLTDMATWKFHSYGVVGATGSDYCMSDSSKPLSIVRIDESNTSVVKAKIDAVEAGIDPDTVTEANVSTTTTTTAQ